MERALCAGGDALCHHPTLNKALHEVLADPDLKKHALDLGIDAKASTPAELDARMRADIEKWGKVIAQAGIAKQ
jgi:tripartite-type tricarboxylate transporter receptor subunit TctC